MKKRTKVQNKLVARRVLIIFSALFGLYLLLIITETLFFENRFGVNVKIADVDVSGKSKTEATQTLMGAWQKYKSEQVGIGSDTYKASELIKEIDVAKTVDNSLSKQQAKYLELAVIRKQNYLAEIVVQDDKISSILSGKYDKYATAPVNAKLVFGDSVQIEPEKDGIRLALPESKEKLVKGLANFDRSLDLKLALIKPELETASAQAVADQVFALIKEPINLTSTAGDYTISSAKLKSWVKVVPDSNKSVVIAESFLPTESRYQYFDEGLIKQYVRDLAGRINQIPANATLGLQNGQVVIVTSEKIGYQLNEDKALDQLINITKDNRDIALVVETKKAEIRTDNFVELGLKELVSTGWSNFAGSPTNRIHNVKTGASKFNGVLIKPDEDFSFNKALGPVEAYTGYLPELVILQNKTVPQYGGGLCQVSSTAFRAALNAGLPILERTMHAYPVTYYKPYGVDATIYLPKPDLVFNNNTGKYIFIQTRIVGTKLYFDFYGTKPTNASKFGGVINGANAVGFVEDVSPSLYDQGARGVGSFTATFYRFITDPGGKTIRTDTFTSKYDSPTKYPH
ncbi:MAG: VanW family protein [bacterium]